MRRLVTDRELWAYTGGLLDPGEEERIAAELKLSPKLRERLAMIQAERQAVAAVEAEAEADTDEISTDEPSFRPWHVPSAGRGVASFGMRATVQAAVFGGNAPPEEGVAIVTRPLGRFGVAIDPGDRDGWVVVLRERSDGWNVVFPPAKDLSLRATDLPLKEGRRVIDLASGARPGVDRWCLVIYDGEIDWNQPEATRWTDVKDRLDRRDVPAVSLRVRVVEEGEEG